MGNRVLYRVEFKERAIWSVDAYAKTWEGTWKIAGREVAHLWVPAASAPDVERELEADENVIKFEDISRTIAAED